MAQEILAPFSFFSFLFSFSPFTPIFILISGSPSISQSHFPTVLTSFSSRPSPLGASDNPNSLFFPQNAHKSPSTESCQTCLSYLAHPVSREGNILTDWPHVLPWSWEVGQPLPKPWTDGRGEMFSKRKEQKWMLSRQNSRCPQQRWMWSF